MSKQQDPKAFYDKLKTQLQDTSSWPSEYLYKFIVLSNTSKVKQIETIFDSMGAVINTKQSSNGKYTSISINVKMKNPDAVVAKYLEVTEKVEGVISL
jgi:putative lipoic acid-binding regulatory protein